MSYQYRPKVEAASGGLLTVEQESRRNAELAMTLRRLELERQSLEREAEQVIAVLRALRSTVDGTKAETTRIAAYREQIRRMPPPVHGGRAGLLAATKEMEAYERKIKPRKERKGPAHGSWRRYYQWKCRCESCRDFAVQQSERNRERYQARKQAAA